MKRTSQGQLLVWTKLLTARPGHAGNKIQYFIKTHVTHTPCGTSPSQTKRKKATADCVMLLLLSHAGPTFKSDFVLLALDSPLPISHFPHVFPRFPIRISMHRGKYSLHTCFLASIASIFFKALIELNEDVHFFAERCILRDDQIRVIFPLYTSSFFFFDL